MSAVWAGLWSLLAVCPAPVAAASLPELAPQHRAQQAAELNRRCEACHAEIAGEWRESFHRRSYSDRAVQKALQQEPRPFCRACHAPAANPATAATGWAAENGVSCLTCHVSTVGAFSLTRPGCLRTPTADSSAQGDSACGRCHEFSFPDGQARVRPELMQLTLTEHRASAWAERSCVSCHMPRGGQDGHRTHRFRGGHDAQLLRSALQVRAKRAGSAVQIILTPAAIGHALPTGDMLRRLAVTVIGLSRDGKPAVTQVRYLSRHFAVATQLAGKRVMVTRSDDRLREATTLSFVLANAADQQPILYRVDYHRVIFPGQSRLDGSSLSADGATLDGEIELASGVLAAAAGSPEARPQQGERP